MTTPMTTPTKLGTLDGAPVYEAAMTVRNLAGGFRDAMKMDPAVLQSGDRVFFICEAVVGDLDFSRIDKEDLSAGWTREHVLSAEVVTFVEEGLVKETLDKHKARVALFRDEQSGQQRLPSDAEFDLEHFAGKHAKRRKSGCPSCQAEKDLEAEEKLAARAERAKATAAKKGGKVVDIRAGKG